MRRSARPIAFVILVVATCALAISCTVMNGLHVPSPDADVPEVEASAEAGPDTSDPCDHARPPLPRGSAFGGDEKEFVVAVRTFDYAKDGGTVGFDIDNSCTCGSGTETCITKDKHCDDPNGRDNVLALLVDQLQRVQGYDIQGDLNRRLGEGLEGILIRVQRYNGLANDSDIAVSMYGSGGTGVSDGDGGTMRVPPTFTTADTWTLATVDLIGDPSAKFSRNIASSAYIADNVLVATIDAHIRILEGAYTTFKGAQFTGTIVQTPDGPTITGGTFSGRWPTSEMLGSLALISDPNTGKPFCETPGFDALAKSFICPSADVAVDPRLDNSGVPCDAVSVGFDYTSVPASLGLPTEVDPGVAGCQDAGTIRCDPP